MKETLMNLGLSSHKSISLYINITILYGNLRNIKFMIIYRSQRSHCPVENELIEVFVS